MDGRRSYPNEPEPWYSEDDPRRVPGQRDARYAEFGEVTSRHGGDPRYGDDARYDDGRGFEPRDPDERDVDLRDFEAGGYESGGFDRRGYDDPGFDGQDQPTRRRQTRPTRGKRSGLEMPTNPPGTELDVEPAQTRFHTEALDRNALRRPEQPGWADQPAVAAPAAPAAPPAREESRPTSGAPAAVHAVPTQYVPNAAPAQVYRARRPAIAVLLGVIAVFADVIIALRVFLASLIASGNDHQGSLVGGIFALTGIPMLAIGLYGLATGAATANGPHIGRAWLRTPLAYVPVGLVLLIAAGLALG